MFQGKKGNKNTNQKLRTTKTRKQIKSEVMRELKKVGQQRKKNRGRQAKVLSARPQRQAKYQNLSGVKGTQQNQGFGNKKRIIVKESEYIGEVTVANQPNFQNIYTLPCNPGQSSTFPWLNTIAKNYEKYCFRELTFFFKPEVTEYTVNVNTGKVILSADYDASDAPPATKQQQEDVDPHADGMPYQSIALTLDPKEMHLNSVARFVRVGGLPGSSDIKTYDCANFFLSTQGQTANSTIGELHVRYTVELSIPVIEDTVQAPTNNQVSVFASTGGSEPAGANGVAQTLLLATAVTNGIVAVNTAGSIVPPAGNYLFDVIGEVTDTNANMTSCQLVLKKNNVAVGPTAIISEVGNTNDLSVNLNLFVSCNGSDAITIVATANYSAGTTTWYGYLRITAI